VTKILSPNPEDFSDSLSERRHAPMARCGTQVTKEVQTTAYGPRRRVKIDLSNGGLTEQSHKADCDVNRILKRFEATGLITHVNTRKPVFEDVSSAGDYLDAVNLANRVEETFMNLPAQVRARFSNDPAEFVGFITDPDNEFELEAFGLTQKDVPHVGQPTEKAKVEAENPDSAG
jgi:phage internal scaffolding protein